MWAWLQQHRIIGFIIGCLIIIAICWIARVNFHADLGPNKIGATMNRGGGDSGN